MELKKSNIFLVKENKFKMEYVFTPISFKGYQVYLWGGGLHNIDAQSSFPLLAKKKPTINALNFDQSFIFLFSDIHYAIRQLVQTNLSFVQNTKLSQRSSDLQLAQQENSYLSNTNCPSHFLKQSNVSTLS